MPVPSNIDKSQVKYFKIKWDALVSVPDTFDADEVPDLAPLTGAIILKPNLAGPIFYRNTPVPFTVVPMKRTINLDLLGEIEEQSRLYVSLEAADPNSSPVSWSWNATFALSYQGVSVSIPSFNFMGAPGSVLDFSNEIPIVDIVSGIAYARGAQGYGVGSVVVNGANYEFYSNAPVPTLISTVPAPTGGTTAYDGGQL